MAAIPCDNHIRAMLDPVAPSVFHPVFGTVLGELERSGSMAEFRRLGDHVLIAFDGTEYFSSNKLHCPALFEPRTRRRQEGVFPRPSGGDRGGARA
jgi:hypothetical protein